MPVRRKAFTTAYFELYSCIAWVSDFQLQSKIVMAMGHQLGHLEMENWNGKLKWSKWKLFTF